MKKYFITSTLLFALNLLVHPAYGQQEGTRLFGKKPVSKNCASYEYEMMLQEHYGTRLSEAQFEEWLAPKVNAIKLLKAQQDAVDDALVTLPVVVHIIHNGDPLGTNENITDDQVNSQITILNQDYGRLPGTPGFNENPVGAATGIQFCLAKMDPRGLPTTGIVRHDIERSVWEMQEIEAMLKPQTQWDPNLYLNIWVVSTIQLDGQSGLKGYAQFPMGSDISGVPDNGSLQQTDGVVIEYRWFGSPEVYPGGNYYDGNAGRTATHEIGHYLGLRHIWGDGNSCSSTDYCADTPSVVGPTQGNCPATKDTCPNSAGEDMIENYMDYSSETCMNVFTEDQSERMHAVLNSSYTRTGLLTSGACSLAQNNLRDGSLDEIEVEFAGCDGTSQPSLTLFNAGTEVLSSATIGYSIDGGATNSFVWSGSLVPSGEIAVQLPEISVAPGLHILNTSILSLNGSNDQNGFNDLKTKAFNTPENINTSEIAIIVRTNYHGSDTTWELKDSNGALVASGGPYQDMSFQQQPEHIEEVNVDDNTCYTFTINDASGDGICCDDGLGYYVILAGNQSMITFGGVFNATETKTFGVNLTLSKDDFSSFWEGVKLYPNPANDVVKIDMTASAELPQEYEVYNSLGQLVSGARIMAPVEEIKIENYSKGVYFLRLTSGDASRIFQFIKI